MLDNILGQLDGFFSGGEIRYLWERSLIERRACGCGRDVTECEVWSRVLERLQEIAGPSALDARAVVAQQKDFVRVRHTGRLLRLDAGGSSGAHHYARLVDHLYRAIADITGAGTIVDSSKRPSDAAIVRLAPGSALKLIHLVRDPRAVAYSWRRLKSSPDRPGAPALTQHGPVESTLHWLTWNRAIASFEGRTQGPALIRYEDFVARPRTVVGDIVGAVTSESLELPFVDEHTTRLAGNHTISGNPSRFVTGSIEIRNDDEWLRKQRRRDRAVVTMLAGPILRAYNYPVRCARS